MTRIVDSKTWTVVERVVLRKKRESGSKVSEMTCFDQKWPEMTQNDLN